MRRNNYFHLRVWKKHHGEIPKDSEGRSYEIHHIDGNSSNNHIDNLQCLSIYDHLEIHKRQHDWGAVQAIMMRLNLTEENRKQIGFAASQHQKKLMADGVHNWQKMSQEERSELSRRIGLQTAKDCVGIHKINADPLLAQENGRKAGKKSAEKCAGFLDTTSQHHGSKHVKGTVWWQNINTGERKRRAISPGDEWIRSMGITASKGKKSSLKGIPWWHDDNKNRVRAITPPNETWKKGMK